MLKIQIESLAKETADFRTISQAVGTVHGVTHTKYKLEVSEIFCVRLFREDQRFFPL